MILATSQTPIENLPEVLVPILMVVAVVGVGVLLIISIRGKISRRQAATPLPREHIEKVKSPQFRREDQHAMTAEMFDIAKRLSSQLDNKAERLEQLLEQADARIGEIAQVLDSVDHPPEVAPTTPMANSPESRLADAMTPPPTEAQANRSETRMPEISTQPQQRNTPKPASSAGAAPTPTLRDEAIAYTPVRENGKPPRNIDPLTKSVYELADAGRNAVSIAQELQEQIGKVELILALRAS